MRLRRSQYHTANRPLLFVVIKPILTGFETCDDRVTGRSSVLGGVLAGRAIAASDMPALRASAKVQPPAARRQTLNAAVAGGFRLRIYVSMFGPDVILQPCRHYNSDPQQRLAFPKVEWRFTGSACWQYSRPFDAHGESKGYKLLRLCRIRDNVCACALVQPPALAIGVEATFG
jgi:hypothetical protein